MSAESNANSDATAFSPGAAQAIKNVVRFHELQPSSAPSSGENTKPISLYKYTDKARSDFMKGAPAAVASGELRLTTGVGGPGEGAPLHDHTAEELMFIASGSWVVFFDEAEEQKVFLEPMDAILVPANVVRGSRNVGQDTGCFLNISGIHDEMLPASSSPTGATSSN